MTWLNDYDSWQIECLIFSSQLTLNLLSKDAIVTFIHRLMDKGLYDDLMLNVIDDDPIYPAGGFQEIYQQIAQNLQLPFPTVEQAKWVITLDALSPYLATPYHYGIFQLNEYQSIYQTYEMFFDNWQDIYQDIEEELKYLLYRIDDALPHYVNQDYELGYSDFKTIKEMKTAFFLSIEAWLNRNQATLQQIFKELLDKK